MGRALLVLLWMGLAGCVKSESVVCGDMVCPVGSRCDDVHALCISADQATVCAGLVDGAVCAADGRGGICDRSVCLPGCGDAVADGGEECDDGNFASYDGCSSACLLEQPTWVEYQDAWKGRTGHAAELFVPTSGIADAQLVVFGGVDASGVVGDGWVRTGAMRDWKYVGNGIPPRRHAATGFDPVRRRLVVFGGVGSVGDPPTNDTWEYEASQGWKQITPTASPPARYGASLAWNSATNRLVLFGGTVVGELGSYSDTWEYNGTTWIPITISGSPPPMRYFHAMASDPTGRVFVFGGLDPTTVGAPDTDVLAGTYRDTWIYQYNGATAATWTKLSVTNGPAYRFGASMAFLPAATALRPRIVLYGGSFGTEFRSDTWELDSTQTWVQVTGGAVSPPARRFATLTYDGTPAVKALVLVGGTRRSDSTPEDDVWELSIDSAGIASWREFSPQRAPAARFAPLVYDEVSRRTITHSGYRGEGMPGGADTWSFGDDPLAWHGAAPQTGMPGRYYHVSAYDPVRKRVVVFGGSLYSTTTPPPLLNDTWEYNSATGAWTQFGGSAPTPPRTAGSLAFDGKRLVLFGGASGTFMRLGDTWEYDGTKWTAITAAAGPPAQYAAAMTYDPIGARAIMLDSNSDTWAYANGAWTKLETTSAPPPRTLASLAFHPRRQRIVMFGGIDADNSFSSALWELGPDDADATKLAWKEITVKGTIPPPRQGTGFAAHPPSRALVVFGGMGGGGPLRDTWLLRWISNTPADRCGMGDEDGDKQVGSADPDCQP
jgi:cysteine-rich repeat protein